MRANRNNSARRDWIENPPVASPPNLRGSINDRYLDRNCFTISYICQQHRGESNNADGAAAKVEVPALQRLAPAPE